MLSKIKIITPTWLKNSFKYTFDLGEVDSQFFKRVENTIQENGGEIIAIDENSLSFKISTLSLSKYQLIRALSFGGLMRSIITLHLDEKKQCIIVVQSTSKKTLYQLFFSIFGLTLSIILLKDGKFLDVGVMLIITLIVYTLASHLPSTNEYPRLKSYFQNLKN